MDIISILNWASLILFYTLIIWFFYSRRKDLVSHWYLFYAYRSKVGLNAMRKLASKLGRFWRVYGYICIPLGFILMVVIVGTLMSAVINFLKAPAEAAPAVGLVLPWASSGVHGPIITVSIWYFIIAAGITLLVHEGAHAVVAAAHKMKLKSSGVGLFAIIPFAFVEPDMDAVENSSLKKKLSVFAAGPITNVILAVLLTLLLFFVLLPPIAANAQINGLAITEIDASLPAGSSALKEGDIITQIDNTSFVNVGAERAAAIAPNYKSVLRMPLKKYDCLEIAPAQTITLTTAGGKSVSLVAAISDQNTSKGLMGLSFAHVVEPKSGSKITLIILGVLFNLLAWVALFNLGIGLFNLLPFSVIDGGQMLRAALHRAFKRNKLGPKLFVLVSALTLFVLLISMFGPWLAKLFG